MLETSWNLQTTLEADSSFLCLLPSSFSIWSLSSGDADLLDAVEFLSEQGKRIELAVFSEGVSTELQARADQVYWINDFADEVGRDQ